MNFANITWSRTVIYVSPYDQLTIDFSKYHKGKQGAFEVICSASFFFNEAVENSFCIDYKKNVCMFK